MRAARAANAGYNTTGEVIPSDMPGAFAMGIRQPVGVVGAIAPFVVERGIADAFVERLVEKTKGLKSGDPKEHDTIIGPLINEDALATVKRRVDDAVAKGRRCSQAARRTGPTTRPPC